MCGHVGIAGKLEHKDESTLKRLLIYDYFRGPDSTGLASIRNNGDVKIAKIASNPIDLFDMGRFKEALSGYNSKALIGHNRLATKGVVNNQNAHPYQYGHIVGAHNGTLDKSSWDKLCELSGEKTDVDSQAIFACIAKIGIEETVKHMSGAWALVWYDTEEGTLNFLRNNQRPLWYAYDEKFERVFWASEWPFIDAAIKTSSSAYKLYQDKEGHGFFSVSENWHYKFDLDALKKGGDTRPKPRVKELKGKEVAASSGSRPFPPSTHQGNHGWVNRGTNSTQTSTTGSTTGTGTGGTTVKNFITDKDEPFCGYITKERFTELTKAGCSWCLETVDYDTPGIVYDERFESILCPKCTGAHSHNRVYTTSIADIDKVLVFKTAA